MHTTTASSMQSNAANYMKSSYTIDTADRYSTVNINSYKWHRDKRVQKERD